MTEKDGNQIYHILTDGRHASDIEDVRSYRGVDLDSYHIMVVCNYKKKSIK